MKMNRMDKSSIVKLWRLALPGLLVIAPFVTESRAQSLPKPQITITSLKREPLVGDPLFKSKLKLLWTASIPSGIQLNSFSLQGSRRQSSSGSGLLPGGSNSIPANVREAEVKVLEPIETPVTFNIQLRAFYTLNPASPIIVRAQDAQRGGRLPDAGVAPANGTLDPLNPVVTLTKVEQTSSAGSLPGGPLSFNVTVVIRPQVEGSGCGGGAFGGTTGVCTSPGFVLKTGLLDLSINLSNGATVRADSKRITNAGKFTFSIPRQQGAVPQSFLVKLTGITAQFEPGSDFLQVLATRNITL